MHFSCDEGYELQGSKSISCLRVTDSYVGWSDDRPICRGKHHPMSCSSLHMYNGSSPSVPSIYVFIVRYPGVDVFACECAVIRGYAQSILLSTDSVFSVYCDWPDFDLWPAFL